MPCVNVIFRVGGGDGGGGKNRKQEKKSRGTVPLCYFKRKALLLASGSVDAT